MKVKVLVKRIIIISTAIFITSGCIDQLLKSEGEKTNHQKQSVKSPIISKPSNEKTIVSKATLGDIGDILINNEVYEDAEQQDGTYNFEKMFVEVKKTLQKPDILVANQETMIGKELGLSSYPSFIVLMRLVMH